MPCPLLLALRLIKKGLESPPSPFFSLLFLDQYCSRRLALKPVWVMATRPPPSHGQPKANVDADLVHGVDDFIRRDEAFNARQRHIGGGNGKGGIDAVALDAGHFHQAGHRVAGKAQLSRRWPQRGCIVWACLPSLSGQRQHGRRRTYLRLAAPGRAGNGGAGRDHSGHAACDHLSMASRSVKPNSSWAAIITPGKMPEEPQAGAATMMPMAALYSEVPRE